MIHWCNILPFICHYIIPFNYIEGIPVEATHYIYIMTVGASYSAKSASRSIHAFYRDPFLFLKIEPIKVKNGKDYFSTVAKYCLPS